MMIYIVIAEQYDQSGYEIVSAFESKDMATFFIKEIQNITPRFLVIKEVILHSQERVR